MNVVEMCRARVVLHSIITLVLNNIYANVATSLLEIGVVAENMSIIMRGRTIAA